MTSIKKRMGNDDDDDDDDVSYFNYFAPCHWTSYYIAGIAYDLLT